ncbi:hypothetical protein CBOM_06785 [Ceraceosorus bombacis]|uniref:Senescence domain-containing protein n=1 Tax=Ceraceosorus bombacis TaxID=401625 RepID=A0A0P1BSH4_9BASI|nr:hypothetical protein CBOM_06785 [Ceraceosorus bombacis]
MSKAAASQSGLAGGASSSNDQGTRGVCLLELPGVSAEQRFEKEVVPLATGTLQLLVLTLNIDNPYGAPPGSEKSLQDTDIWLVLSIGNDFSLPIPSTQRVFPDRSSASYNFPQPDTGASIRIYLSSHDAASQGLRDAFEDVLAQYCAFASDDRSDAGQIELLDEHGQVMGTLAGSYNFKEDSSLSAVGAEKQPVLVDLEDLSSAANGTGHKKDVDVRPAPTFQDDWLLKGANYISRGIVNGSTFLGGKLQGAASSYVERTAKPSADLPPPHTGAQLSADGTHFESLPGQPVPGLERSGTTASTSGNYTTSGKVPLTFNSHTHAAAKGAHNWTGKVVNVSSATTNAILNKAGAVGSSIGKRTGIQSKPGGPPPTGWRGAINRSLIAANMVIDGLEQGAERLITDTGEATGKVIEHRYGSEAKIIGGQAGSIGKGCFAVYKDISGVRRKCLLRVAGGTFKARMDDGREIVMAVEPAGAPGSTSGASTHNTARGSSSSSAPPLPSKENLHAPPAYSAPARGSYAGEKDVEK